MMFVPGVALIKGQDSAQFMAVDAPAMAVVDALGDVVDVPRDLRLIS